MTTPKGITFIVVGTLAFLSIVFILTLAYCSIFQITIEGDTFKMAGASCLSALTALLVNTRSQSPDPSPQSSNVELNLTASSPVGKETPNAERTDA